MMTNSRGLTLSTGDDYERHFRDAMTLLRSVRITLADLLEQVVEGGHGALKELGAKQADLETALRRAFDAEARWNEYQGKQAGPVAGEIDFDSIRHDIGCRLARLRDCCQED